MSKHPFFQLATIIFFIVATLNLHFLRAQTGNTRYGQNALNPGTTGSYNSAFGYAALSTNTTGSYNTATGSYALRSNSTGKQNSAYGSYSLFSNTTGVQNTAVGSYALRSNSTGAYNTAAGYHALFFNSTGYENSAYGNQALASNTTGNQNIAIGASALYSNTSGNSNTACGSFSLYANNTGVNNTAFGFFTLLNTTASNNTATGYSALRSNSTGSGNNAYGNEALRLNTSGSLNNAYGYRTLYSNTSGFRNTAYGNGALYNNTTGTYNSALGYNAGSSFSNLTNTTALGALATTTASNQVRIGNTSVTKIGGHVSWTTFSDGRFKQNIKQDVHGLDFINSLKPITYTVDVKGVNAFYGMNRKPSNALENDQMDEEEVKAEAEASKIVYNGFVAQEVEDAANKLNYNFSGIDKPKNNIDFYGLRYAEFVVPLVKAVQQLSKLNEDKDAKINSLQKQIDELKAIVLNNNENNILLPAEGNTKIAIASLAQNVPNPFAKATTISYSLPQRFLIAQIKITDKNGKQLKLLNVSESGKGTVIIDTSTFSSGAYNYSLVIDGKIITTKQMVVAR